MRRRRAGFRCVSSTTPDHWGGDRTLAVESLGKAYHDAVKDTTALLTSNPYPMSPEAYRRQASAYLQFDALDRLGAITAPTLVVVGEQDLLTPG